ncbi:MAG TPA: isopentenyl transferase family protein, partial [Bacteroidales bacterium]|nr:isopentenyl transferase family protein [Bacteroidales bacterium]HQN15060.1 isopentenyl transferase family protein [Bacteroidales bacterium]HQP15774.1 isopentenyl transferase family protein [Bacteroidales bacterium]
MGIQQLSPGQKHLIIILGPTAVGKTSLAINLAQHFKTEIISADSRQFYREMTIGTAKPSPEELALVRHHLVGMLSISDYYNVFRFETEV